jgi:multimeric flavodoxin WrbA
MAGKNVIIVKGSPRLEGNSAILADEVAAGAKSVGAHVESYDLHEMDIQPCDACNGCRASAECVLDDDMQLLYAKIREADAMVIASPVYWFNVTAQTKAFIDRFYAFAGEKPLFHSLKKITFGVVMTGEGRDPFPSGAVNAFRSFQDTFRYIGADLMDMIYGSAYDEGEIKTNTRVMKAAFKMGKKISS